MFNAFDQHEGPNGARYPEALRFRLPRGFRCRVKQAASVEGVAASEFIRRAIGERIERVTGGNSARGRLSSCGAGA